MSKKAILNDHSMTRDYQLAVQKVNARLDFVAESVEVMLPASFFSDLHYEYLGTSCTDRGFDCHLFAIHKPGFDIAPIMTVRKDTHEISSFNFEPFIWELFERTFGSHDEVLNKIHETLKES